MPGPSKQGGRSVLSLAVETHELSKRFPGPVAWRGLLRRPPGNGTLAVDRVSLEIRAGEIFGLLGPNGAGKSTLVRLLCTLILPTGGQARICGHDISDELAVKAHVGLAAGEERSFYWRLNGRENLRFYGALQGLPAPWVERRIAELEESLHLEDALGTRFDRLSTGMRRRLDLARALLHHPDVLFLDEPTRSLDPGAAAGFHELIRRVAQAGHTILLVTHQLHEAETLCDRIAIMHQGRLRAASPVAELRRAIGPGRRYQLTLAAPGGSCPPIWMDWPWPVQEEPAAKPEERRLQVELPAATPLDAVLKPLLQAGIGILDATMEETPLEEIFRRLTAADIPEPPPAIDTPILAPLEKAHDSPPESGAAPHRSTPRPPLPEADQAATPPRLPPLQAALRKAFAFLRRDLRVQMSYRLATLLQLLGILFSVSAFYFVARVLGQAASPYLTEYGGDYFAFVLIGIAFAGYQGVGMSAFAEAIRSGQTQGTLEAMLVTPTRLEAILSASALWSFLQASLQVVLYLAVGVLLFGAPLGRAHVGTALLILFLSIAAFSGLGILSASFILVTKRGNPINFLFGSLSGLLSGVYYPVAVLPAWLQPLSVLLPMTHALRAMRLALLEGARPSRVAPELALLALFTAVVLPSGLLAFRWALRRARIEGSLTQY